MANLLLIESPGKVKKLGQILGSGWVIKASMGHVRELANDGEDALGFDLGAASIDCRYQPRDDRAKKVFAHPRTLDQSLVAAGRARDCLDKLVGYKGSRHVVWPLNNGAKSMGRVQSATLYLLCVRERAIQAFVPQDYWSVWVTYGEGFKAFYRSSPKPQRQPGKDAEAKGAEHESERVTTQERAEFTAQMETALDAIATGDQDWQAYLIGWNQGYFAPAIAQAKSQLLSLPTFAEPPHLREPCPRLNPQSPGPNLLPGNRPKPHAPPAARR